MEGPLLLTAWSSGDKVVSLFHITKNEDDSPPVVTGQFSVIHQRGTNRLGNLGQRDTHDVQFPVQEPHRRRQDGVYGTEYGGRCRYGLGVGESAGQPCGGSSCHIAFP